MGEKLKKIWTIRKAELDDANSLQNCMQAAYAGYQERMQGKRLPPMDIDFSVEIAEFPTWVADLAGDIIGGLTMIFEDDYASIANIAVDPNYQGQGVGSGLLRFADEKASEQSYSELCLATHVLLHETLSLYQHLGWVETGRDDVRVYMKKVLKPGT